MPRLLYEQSTSYGGHLIIPFVCQRLVGHDVFSYRLLSEWGYKGRLHRAENPGALYSSTAAGITQIAKDYIDMRSLDDGGDRPSQSAMRYHTLPQEAYTISLQNVDYFQNRYTYHQHLIIVFQARRKFFYDHYPPTSLKNIAAPKIFNTERSCLTWIKRGIDSGRSATSELNGWGVNELTN
ncbi:MAG: hypothetical protein F6K30_18235 [Cyanothece sp. SIO2G6]|nr:hypothetical protein [Cyanothece sp. SIO2G6]